MTEDQINLIIADSILVVHFAFVLFVILGQLLVIIGGWRNWHWVHNLRFRIAHLLAIGVVVLQAWLGATCPLTRWEASFRQAAGEASYHGSFIAHWLNQWLYYDAPAWVFTLVYTLFAALVVFSWYWVRPSAAQPAATHNKGSPS